MRHSKRLSIFAQLNQIESIEAKLAQSAGWKSMLLYQYQIGYMFFIMATTYASIYMVVMEAAFVIGSYEEAGRVPLEIKLDGVYLMEFIYLLDSIFRLCYKITPWDNQKLYYEPEVVEVLIISAISLVPYELFHGLLYDDHRMFVLLRLRVVLRILRPFKIERLISKIFSVEGGKMLVFRIICLLLLLTYIFALYHFLTKCSRTECKYRDFDFFLDIAFVSVRSLLSKAVDVESIAFASIIHVYCLGNLICQTYMFFMVAKLICTKIDIMLPIYVFAHNYNTTLNTYKYWKTIYKDDWTIVDEQLGYTLTHYYHHFLAQRNGILYQDVPFKLLPVGIRTTLTVDMAFDAMKHTHLFRDQDVEVTRYLSTLVSFEFGVPGQVLIKKQEVNNRMIYIKHGLVQVLSQEDGETPILNLSGGTCLGESALFVPYPASCTVVCQTYCEMVVMTMQSVSEMRNTFPNLYKNSRQMIFSRIEDARILQEVMQDYQRKSYPAALKNDVLITNWIQGFQRQIDDMDLFTPSKGNVLSNIINDMTFFTPHLDRLVVSDEIDLIKDLVFLKSSCHFILQPNSPVLKIWNFIILIWTLIYTFLFPVFYVFSYESVIDANVTYITGTLLYLCDVYIQVFTAVKTRGATYPTPRTILMHRMKQISFNLDCIAAFPVELIVVTVWGNVTNRIFLLLQSNRLLKYYKIITFHQKIKVSLGTRTATIISITQFFLHGFFLNFYTAFFLYAFNCKDRRCNPDFENFYKRVRAETLYQRHVATYSLAVSLTTGLNFGELPNTGDGVKKVAFIAVSVIFFIHLLLFIASASSLYGLLDLVELETQEKLGSIGQAIHYFELEKQFNDRIDNYLKKLWFFRKEIVIDVNYLSKDLEKYYKNIHFSRFFRTIPIFADLPTSVLSDFCMHVTRFTIPANHVIYYSGEVSAEFCMLEKGQCQLIDAKSCKDIQSGDIIGLLEVLLDEPRVYSAVTLTDCIVLQVTKSRFQYFLTSYPKLRHEFQEALNHSMFNSREAFQKMQYSKSEDNIGSFLRSSRKSTIRDHKKRFLDSVFTVRPTYGKFVLYWEIGRCICIYMNALTGVLRFFTPTTKLFQLIILYCMDIISVIDIIFRCFISYFDENGIEIFDIKKTSRYYITHAFCVDLLGTIPIDLFLSYDIVITRINRGILLYRIYGLLDHVTNSIKKIKHFIYVNLLLLTVYFVCFIASINVNIVCTFDPSIPESEKFTAGLSCKPNRWPYLSEIPRPVSPSKVYYECILLITSFVSGVGFKRFVLGGWEERLYFVLLGKWCATLRLVYAGKAVACILFMNADLTIYQQAMKNLVIFLSYCRIDTVVKEEVINHFEYIWKTRRGKDIGDVIESFPTALKQDTLYSIYGASMQVDSIFGYADEVLIKNVLLVARQNTFRKTGILYSVNDIHGTIFYLLKGFVEVVGPDKNRLQTLPPGSIFGCLDNVDMARQTLTMVARGHVETLAFSSIEFHKIISKYPLFKYLFRRSIVFNVDFIVGDHPPPQVDKSESRPIVFRKFGFKTFVPTKRISRLEMALYIFEFFFSCPLSLIFHILRPNYVIYCILYGIDLLWFIRMYYLFNLAYENEYGMLVYDRKLIRQRYLKKKTGFYFDLVASFPLDIIAAILSSYNLFKFLRINRFLRGFHLYNYMAKTKRKLNINVFTMRIIHILMMMFIYIETNFALLNIFETIWKSDELTTNQILFEALTHIDSIVFILSGTCVPYVVIYTRDISLLVTYMVFTRLFFVAVFYANFSSTIQIVTKTSAKYKRDCHTLYKFLDIMDTSPSLVDDIKRYMGLLRNIRNGIQFPFLLEEAPYYLREAVLNSMFGFHLRNHCIFKNCHVDFIRQLSATMRTLTFFEGNTIASSGDVDEAMYFIHEGAVAVITNDSLFLEKVETVLVHGACFGLSQVLYDNKGHFYTYRANKLTILVVIERREIQRLLKFFPASKSHIYDSPGLMESY